MALITGKGGCAYIVIRDPETGEEKRVILLPESNPPEPEQPPADSEQLDSR